MRPGVKSIYLKNEAMKATLMCHDDWAPFIPASNVGLFTSHIQNQLEVIKSDEERMEELDGKISGTVIGC